MRAFHAITRAISPRLADCALTHVERSVIDVRMAVAQHGQYERLLVSLGGTVERLAGDDAFPDCVFIEDTAVVTDEFALITRPGSPARRGEATAVRTALERHRPVTQMIGPGTLDGGDVLKIGQSFYVGLSTRTNQQGLDQLARLAEPHGYQVRGVSFGECLHLKTGVTLVTEDTLLLNPQWVEAALFPEFRILNVHPEEPFAANCLRVGGTVIQGGGYPRTTERLRALGIDVRTSDLSELAKAEGGVTCCSLILSPSAKRNP